MTNKTDSKQPLFRVGRKGIAAIAGTLAISLLVFGLSTPEVVDTLSALSEPEALSAFIAGMGPLAVVVLLALAVVVSPIPSGPIAMAAGALFGTLAGGALTAAGAVLGALIAFSLSRVLGYRPFAGSNLPLAQWISRPRTEMTLAIVVLVSRLIPFVSFDAVSYVAGLTTIRPISFAIATTIGVLPASFAFSALGAGMATLDNAMLMIVACGITAILPVAWGVARTVRKQRV